MTQKSCIKHGWKGKHTHYASRTQKSLREKKVPAAIQYNISLMSYLKAKSPISFPLA